MENEPDKRSDAGERSEYQAAGFTEIVLGLRSLSPWASKSQLLNATPKPEYERAYANWVQAVVERYDGDGKGDLPGLKQPVRYFEIGVEFSSYEPDPVADYLRMLEIAHHAVKAASSNALVLHAAFLTTTAFQNRPTPGEYDRAFAAMDQRIAHHSLAELRKILDRPDLFDGLNVHALGEPREIEDLVAWLKWESRQRGYSKPIIISDTAPTPFIAWGRADKADGPMQFLGLIIPPATEADRPRLAGHFSLLIEEDPATVQWTRGLVAADMAKKIVIAAEQGVAFINAAFTEDLPLFKKPARAGAGNSAWAGMVKTELRFGKAQPVLVERYPSFFALAQLQRHLKGYETIERIDTGDAAVRWYRLIWRNRREIWIGWLDSNTLQLPGDVVPARTVEIALGEGGAAGCGREVGDHLSEK